VYLGAFRTDELRQLGGYDERLDANEDFDVAERCRRTGRTVWLEQDLVVGYEPRATAREVLHQYAAFGRAKAAYWRLGKGRPNLRQLAPFVGAGGLLVLAVLLPRALPAVVGAILLAALATDHLAAPEAPSLRVRLAASALSLGMVVAWAAGVVRGLLARPQGQKRVPAPGSGNREWRSARSARQAAVAPSAATVSTGDSPSERTASG
jgi:hypothetical protein